ncbi:MAG: hypothetical protein HZA17_13675 [Nitrospirae bacterium]|nr:hypothetical protein [Nitrospirota bacterium]
MELLIEVLCNLFGEFLLQIGIELLIELGLHQATDKPDSCKPVIAFFGYGILGLAAGGLSLLVFPGYLVRSSLFYGMSLVITPILAGLTMSGIGSLRRRRGEPVLRIDSFLYAAVFAFGVALIRLFYTH